MPRRKKEEQPREAIKVIKTPSIVKGMKDVLPVEEKYWDFVEAEVKRIINEYSYRRMQTPLLEKYEMFNHTLFKQSGVVDKELFSFTDHGEKLALRPEVTASIARAYIGHNMGTQQLPLKVYYKGPMFRQGKASENKWRQFTQVGFEIIGDGTPAIDAELIIISHFLLRNLGIETEVKLNSLGCPSCRPEYKKNLTEYLKTKRSSLPADLKKLITKDPLKVFACTTSKCMKLWEDAPQIIDFLCDDCRNHLFKVLEFLDELKISYRLDPSLLRTFDYYTKTIFEIKTLTENEEDGVVLAGGGRYDNLIEMVGGESTPAAGFAFGVERVINEIKKQKVELPKPEKPDVFVAQISELARQKSFIFFEALRKERFTVKSNFSKAGLKDQLDIAKKLKARIVLILGQKEVSEETVILREQDSGIQEVISFRKVVKEVRKRLKDIKAKEEAEIERLEAQAKPSK